MTRVSADGRRQLAVSDCRWQSRSPACQVNTILAGSLEICQAAQNSWDDFRQILFISVKNI